MKSSSGRFQPTVVSVNQVMIQVPAPSRGDAWRDVRASTTSADAAGRESTRWARLQALADEAIERTEAELLAVEGVMLARDIGLLVRYERLEMLDRLREAAGSEGVPLEGLWLLVPGDPTSERPMLDGAAIPC